MRETGNMMGESSGMKSKRQGFGSLFDMLPEHLVQHILFSFSPPNNRQAIRRSLVSKQFFNLIQNRPALISDHRNLRHGKAELRYMLSTLKRYHEQNIHLHTLDLDVRIWRLTDVDDDDDLPAAFGKCVELAAEKRLVNLRLSRPVRLTNYVLPEAVFGVKSLVRLSLSRFDLQDETIITFPNPRELDLYCLHMSSGAVFEDVIKGCPLIETLKIRCCCRNQSGFHFKVSNLPNLKELHVTLGEQALQVCASAAKNLESMYCCYDPVYDRNIVKIIDLGEHQYLNLKKLNLVKLARMDGKLFKNFAWRFPRLE